MAVILIKLALCAVLLLLAFMTRESRIMRWILAFPAAFYLVFYFASFVTIPLFGKIPAKGYEMAFVGLAVAALIALAGGFFAAKAAVNTPAMYWALLGIAAAGISFLPKYF